MKNKRTPYLDAAYIDISHAPSGKTMGMQAGSLRSALCSNAFQDNFLASVFSRNGIFPAYTTLVPSSRENRGYIVTEYVSSYKLTAVSCTRKHRTLMLVDSWLQFSQCFQVQPFNGQFGPSV